MKRLLPTFALSIFSLSLSLISCATAWSATTTNVENGRGDVPITIPDNYSAEKDAPLVVLLHGYTSSGKSQDAYMKFSKLVDELGFLLITPDGTEEDSPTKNRFWNATNACCNFHGSDVDDSAYLSGLINNVKQSYAVDKNRIYLIGHSNGGYMSHRMAYDHPDTIAAIASLAGAALSKMKGDTPARPVNILQIHGTKDATINYEGGDIGGNAYPSAEGTLDLWANYNGIGTDKKKTLRKKIDLSRRPEGKETTVTKYDKKGSVELWTIHEGGHVPGLSEDFARQVIQWFYEHPKAEK